MPDEDGSGCAYQQPSESQRLAADYISQTRAIDQKASGLLTVVAIVFAVSLAIQGAIVGGGGLASGWQITAIILLAGAQGAALVSSHFLLHCMEMVPKSLIWAPGVRDARAEDWAVFANKMEGVSSKRKGWFRKGWRAAQIAFFALGAAAIVQAGGIAVLALRAVLGG